MSRGRAFCGGFVVGAAVVAVLAVLWLALPALAAPDSPALVFILLLLTVGVAFVGACIGVAWLSTRARTPG